MKSKHDMSEHIQQDCNKVKRWTSDLEFYKVECSFLHNLLDNYFNRLSTPRHIDRLKYLENELIKLEDERHEIDKLLGAYMIQVKSVADTMEAEEQKDLEDKYSKLWSLMEELTLRIRKVKKELYAIIEKVIEEDELYDV